MSGKQEKRINRKIRKALQQSENAIAGRLLEDIKTWTFMSRVRFAWSIIWSSEEKKND